MLTPFGELPNRLAVDMSMQEQHDWLQNRFSRRTLIKGAGLVSASSALLWIQPTRSRAAESQIYGRHIAYGADPRYQVIVGFASTERVNTAIVRLSNGQSAHAYGQMVAGSSATYLRASFDLLQPDTLYQYNLEVDGKTVSGAQFRTAPAGPTSFRFTAFGDQDVGPNSYKVLSRVMDLQPMLHLVAGDLCYADSSGAGGPGDVFHAQRWDRWLTQNNRVASSIPFMVAPGNHEMEPGYGTHGYAGMLGRVAVGGFSPLATPVASSFQVGSVGFVGLDSNDVSYEIPANRGWTDGQQTQWLESTLAGFRRAGTGIDFIVVFHHATPYSTSETHGSEDGVRREWVPLYDKYSVDLVISGHNHCYERSLPLRAGAVTSHELRHVNGAKGTTYVTAGGGGAGFGREGFGSRKSTRLATAGGPVTEKVDWSSAPRGLNHSVLSVDVTPGGQGTSPALHLRALTMNARVMDEWTITRGDSMTSGATKLWLPVGAGTALVAAGGAATVLAARHRRSRPSPVAASAPAAVAVVPAAEVAAQVEPPPG